MSYLSSDSNIQGLQLAVQQLVVKSSDVALVSSQSAASITLDLKQPIQEVRAALFCDDSANTVDLAAATIGSPDSTLVTVVCSASITTDDTIILNYIVE